MEKQRDRIYQLMTEKLAGVISASDEDYIDQLIENDSVIHEKWEEMQSIMGKDSMTNNTHKGSPPWRIKGKTAKQIRFYSWSRGVAACLVLLVLFSIGYTFLNRSSKEEPLIVTVESPSDHISLQLSDGQEINLSNSEGSIQSGNIVLENENQTLSFSATELAGHKSDKHNINTLSVPVGMDFRVNLADGTIVWLNSTTEIKFPFKFSSTIREVEVNGEAYFEVAKDSKRPFIVHLPESDIEVLGTAFNINSYEPDTEKVALVEGAVKIKTPESITNITPGTELMYIKGKGISQTSFDSKEILGWQKGIFYFYDAGLPKICNVIPRWFGIDVVLDNPSIEAKRFAGILDKNQPIEIFLEDLQTITDIEYYFEKGGKELHFRVPE